MNGTNENITKKVLPLAAVLILCAASLVTVAYAYNASYQDTINGQDVPVDETSKYIYITGDGLGYPAAEFKATTSVQYDTVSNASGITATPKTFEITDLTSKDEARPVSYANGIATIKIGDVTVNNKNTTLNNVYVSVAGIEVADLPDGKANLFKDELTTSNIFMKVNGAEGYSNVFKLTQDQAVIEVYIVAEINTNPDVLGVNPEPVEIKEGELASTVKSILYAPEFTLSLAATAGDNLTIASGTVTANDIAEFKTSAANNANFSAKVINDDGASITMDRTAIGLLGSADAELEVIASDLEGYKKAYEINFGDNHFGNGTLTITIPYDGTVTENEKIMVAYLNNGAVDEVYEATYADGFITFTTNHLSTFAVGTSDLANNMAVKLEKDGMTSYYNNVGDAIITGCMGTSVITLLKDVTEDRVFEVSDVTDLTLKLNGKTLTVTSSKLFLVYDESAKLTFDGTVEGSKIDAVGYVVFNNVTSQKLQKFDLTVTGGTYVASHAFIPYNANTVTVTDAKFDVTGSAIWFGNIGAKKVTISNIEVKSGSTGIYLGSVMDATVRNAKVTAAGTALEIKSGNVKILGGEFTGGKYSVDEKIVNHNGTGGAEAVVVVNNGYCREIPGCDSVNVTMDNVTLKYSDATIEGKPMVVYSDVDVDKYGKDAGKDKDITVVWKDNSDKIVTFYNGTSPDITINGTVVEKPKTN